MRVKKFFIGLAFAGLIIFNANFIYAHGVGFKYSSFKALTLEFFYSTGEKMSYREAKVFSPKDNKFAVQTGRTDEEGRFAFIPDCVGEWRVIVRDEEGHQCEAKINIDDLNNIDVKVLEAAKDEREEPLYIRAILGVSIIFNLALIIYRRKS